jgi:hypothetical protein
LESIEGQIIHELYQHITKALTMVLRAVYNPHWKSTELGP